MVTVRRRTSKCFNTGEAPIKLHRITQNTPCHACTITRSYPYRTCMDGAGITTAIKGIASLPLNHIRATRSCSTESDLRNKTLQLAKNLSEPQLLGSLCPIAIRRTVRACSVHLQTQGERSRRM
ncbi:hypothetical protein NPIL_658611 [Nephila pilipes]|uniref:Uncharacterized protein n=1 Tax=Nephila pilipes TaxID=299642 RepID=A0A8X6UDB2_NEPPI|nr:hypothetical protein NPIL_598541 [Nephila pilipes]GFU06978.1 hypothetical protein NPIL_658611 [Nephila pilipes]